MLNYPVIYSLSKRERGSKHVELCYLGNQHVLYKNLCYSLHSSRNLYSILHVTDSKLTLTPCDSFFISKGSTERGRDLSFELYIRSYSKVIKIYGAKVIITSF